MSHPVLYSYRRCPYAMRARLAIYLAHREVEQREIVFWDKPAPMLCASAKGTVPVLILADQSVIDESWDIMKWALQGSEWWLEDSLVFSWVDRNDNEFKTYLDAYKYPESLQDQMHARDQAEVFLNDVEEALQQQLFLLGDSLSILDLAIFPFVRQFAHVDKDWFFSQDRWSNLQLWLQRHLDSDYFKAVMKNRPVWQPGYQPLWVDEPELMTKDAFRKKALME